MVSLAPEVPPVSRYVVVGAGIHGLSTAWHMALRLRESGEGSGHDVLVVDKTGVGAGASGIACGVIRNNYFQPAMRRLMAHSVSVWESDPEAFSYHPVGYLQAACEPMREGVRQIHAEQQQIGYSSTLVEGETDCRAYLRDLFDDWRAPGITSVLHEHRGGYANNRASLRGLLTKALAEGVRVVSGVHVTGFTMSAGTVRAVETDAGPISCDTVVVAVGPWVRDLWAMLGLPPTVRVRRPDGGFREDAPMWHYLLLQEGTLGVDPKLFTDNRGDLPPVVHVDSDTPLKDEDGDLVARDPWGVYYKPDFAFDGVQGGTMPTAVTGPTDRVAVDPYGPDSSQFTVGPEFSRTFTAALSHCQRRFEGLRDRYRDARSGGLGCFTPDSFPVFDVFRDNVYVIADSNHGYKMIGVGDLVASELLGAPSDLLAPFRFSRFERGELHPTSASPFPWS